MKGRWADGGSARLPFLDILQPQYTHNFVQLHLDLMMFELLQDIRLAIHYSVIQRLRTNKNARFMRGYLLHVRNLISTSKTQYPARFTNIAKSHRQAYVRFH